MRHIALLSLLVLTACQVGDDTHTSVATADSVIDFGNFITSCAAGTPKKKLRRRDYWDYGCYSGKGGEGTPVDATDTCAQTHDACWAKVQKDTGVNCFNEHYAHNYNDPATGKATDDCSKWTFAESCSQAKHPSNDTPAELACCACDLSAVQCFQTARPTYDPKYKDWSNNGNPGATCGPNKGKSFACKSGYISRGETCAGGTKHGNRLIGYWCETTCNKPDTCETSKAAGNAYARCVPPPAVAMSCDLTATPTIALALTADAAAIATVDDDQPCEGAACDECPLCTAETCDGNHAPDDTGDENDDLPPDWDSDDLLADPDDSLDETTAVSPPGALTPADAGVADAAPLSL